MASAEQHTNIYEDEGLEITPSLGKRPAWTAFGQEANIGPDPGDPSTNVSRHIGLRNSNVETESKEQLPFCRFAGQFLYSDQPTHSNGGTFCEACRAHQDIQSHKDHRQDRRDIRERMNQNHDFFQRLPVEIASDIFDNAVNSGSPRRSPFFLGRVCSWWRRVAWSTPVLWRTIRFILHDALGAKPSTQSISFALRVELLRGYIARAGTHRLDVNMSELSKLVGENLLSDDNLQVLIGVLKECASQLHFLKLQVPQPLYRLLTEVDAPNLRILTVKRAMRSGDAYDQPGPPVDVTLFSRYVEELTIKGWEQEELVLSYSEVKDLSIIGCSTTVCTKALASTKILKTCIINLDFAWHHPFVLPPLLRLEGLAITDWGPFHDDFNLTFSQTVMPQLKRLQLTDRSTRIPFDYQEFIRFVRRSACNDLKHLELPVASWTGPELRQLLGNTPNLEYLSLSRTIEGPSLSDAIIAIVVDQVCTHLADFDYIGRWPPEDQADKWSWLPAVHHYLCGEPSHFMKVTLFFILPSFYIPDSSWLPLEFVDMVEELEEHGFFFLFLERNISGRLYDDFVGDSIAYHERAALLASDGGEQ